MIFNKNYSKRVLLFQGAFIFSLQAMGPENPNSQEVSPHPSVIQTTEPGILQRALSRVNTTARVVGSLGKASLHVPSIVKLVKVIKSETIQDIKKGFEVLQTESVQTMIEESNKVILTAFVVSNLLKIIFSSMIQSMNIGSVFNNTSTVGHSVGKLFGQIVDLNELTGGMISVLFSPETIIGLKDVSRLLSSFSIRLTRISSSFVHSSREQDFLRYMRLQLNRAVDESIKNSRELQVYLQQKVGGVSIQELMNHFNEFILFPDQQVTIKDLVQVVLDLKGSFVQSTHQINIIYPRMKVFLKSLGDEIEHFSQSSIIQKLTQASAFPKSLGDNIEGVILVSTLLIDQARSMVSAFLKAMSTLERQLSVPLISRDLIEEFRQLWKDIDLLRSALISVAVGLPSSDLQVLIDLRSQLNLNLHSERISLQENQQEVPIAQQPAQQPAAEQLQPVPPAPVLPQVMPQYTVSPEPVIRREEQRFSPPGL